MAHNGYIMHNEKPRRLYADDLSEGQTLIAIDNGRWADSPTRLTKYTVKKVLKTRLVLTVAGGSSETRMIVRRDRWTPQGEVTRKIEGQGEYGSGLTIATEDDPIVEEARKRSASQQVRSRARQAVLNADKNLNRESALAALQALQAYLEATPE